MLDMHQGLIAPCPECGDEAGVCSDRWGNTPEGKAYLESVNHA